MLRETGTDVEEASETMRPSRKGNYLSLGLAFQARDAAHVLEVYALLRSLDNVIMCL